MLSKGTPENLAKARDLFERAVALDSENVDAIVGAARIDIVSGANYFCDDRAERLAAAEAALTKGLSIAPRNFWAHLWMGLLHISTNRAGRGIAELEQALALNRNLAAAHGGVGLAKIFLGRAEESAAHVAVAFRIAPGQTRSRRGRGGCGTVPTLARRQSNLSAELFLHRSGAGAPWRAE
jgi:tetratricopeptide (TPR) repeat protein